MESLLYPEFMLAEGLIQASLLREINAEHIRQRAPNGAVLISCGDRDRFKQHFTGCNGLTDVHPICLNGGGVLLGNDVDALRQNVVLEDCIEAFAVKGLSFILDLSHFPCAKCVRLGFGFREMVLRTLEGKAFLKENIPIGLDGVLPLISIDWRNAHIKQEHGVKLYAARLQDMRAIASFKLPDTGVPVHRRDHRPHPAELRT